MTEKRITALIAAAGSGSRMKSSVPKQFLDLCGKPILARTLSVFENSRDIDEIVVVTREDNIEYVRDMAQRFKIEKLTAVVTGGDTRQQSIINGLNSVSGDYVLIHDGARPFVTIEQIERLSEAVLKNGAAALGIPVTDTLKSADENKIITGTVDRDGLYSIQTPQGFKTELIKSAHKKAIENGLVVTDDCALCENVGIDVEIVDGSPMNIKITTPDDLILAEGILKKTEDTHMRIGVGYDVHKLVENRDLILGGVKIPYELGLLGHSDADVLLHAIMDAMLGAAALGDIGKHFPDTDERFKGADSIELLKAVGKILSDNGYTVLNIDATIIAQRPKLLEYIPQMIKNIEAALSLDAGYVSVKATTTEKLGFCGRGEGIAAEAVCCIQQK